MILNLVLSILFQVHAGPFSSTVIDFQTGAPIAGATIALEGTTLKTKSDSTGHFILSPAPYGRCRLRISHAEYQTAYRTIVLSDTTNLISISLMSRRLLYGMPVEKKSQ